MSKITTPEMEVALANWFDYRVNLIVPNVHWGMNMHECDLLIVSKAGYATEVEIKISRAGLRADAKKSHGHRSNSIKYLYFAVPDYIIADGNVLKDDVMAMIPERAGIITVRAEDNVPGKYPYHPKCKRIREPTANKAATKMSDRDRYKVARLGALRIWGLKSRLAEAQDISKAR